MTEASDASERGGSAANPRPRSDEALRAAAIAEGATHRSLIRSAHDGAVLSALMRPLYALGTPRGHGVLTTIGRKTGQDRRKCIRVVRQGDRAYVVMLRPPAVAVNDPRARSAWVRNLEADPHVRLRLGFRTYAGTAREITDLRELHEARATFVAAVFGVDYGEHLIHRRGPPTRARIQQLHEYWFDTGIPILIELRVA